MSRIIVITSLKGGVGKTTVAANLAMTLARKGKSVVAIDCDLESRCLDMILGLENDSLYNLSDILAKKCSLDDAIVRDTRCDNLNFVAAPTGISRDSEEYSTTFTSENVALLIKELCENYDYVIFDLPAHPDKWYDLLLEYADYALVVAMHTAVSVRSAEKTATVILDTYERLLTEKGKADGPVTEETHKLKIRLIINSFKPRDISDGIRSGVYDIISKTSVKLLGIVPYDEKMAAAQESGVLAYQLKGDALSATGFSNIAARLEGSNIPLLSGILKKKARKKTL